MVTDLVEPPVQLTKMIGDAAMLVSGDTDALLDAALALVEAAQKEGADFPELKAGADHGEAIHRAGDWFGSPVNVASRVTAIARPGSVLVTTNVKDAAKGEYDWSFAGKRSLKGVNRELSLFRVRRLPAPS
jgi:adenylate cyclase